MYGWMVAVVFSAALVGVFFWGGNMDMLDLCRPTYLTFLQVLRSLELGMNSRCRNAYNSIPHLVTDTASVGRVSNEAYTVTDPMPRILPSGYISSRR